MDSIIFSIQAVTIHLSTVGKVEKNVVKISKIA
jgi:hypothetical protein